MSKRLTASGSFTVATIEDGVSVEARYAPNNNPTPSQIHTTWRDGDIYMSTRESDSSVWSDWHKMVGESGGETVYSFNISKEKTSGGATTAPSNCFFTTWKDTPIAPTSAYPYLWMQIQKKDGNGNPVGDASYARVTGELGIDYEIRCAIDSIKIPKDTTSTSVSTTFNFYYKESGKTPIAYNAYYGIYYRIGTVYTLISSGSSSSASLSAYSVDNTKTAVVVFMFSASYSGNDPMSQSYLAKLELPIYEDGKDGSAPNPNILLRTVFDRGIDKVKEKWAGDWNYVGIDAASDTVIDGRKSIRISAEYASTYKDFAQNVYGRIKTDTWYTLSFYYYSTSTFWTYIYDGTNTYGIVDRTVGYYIDGVYNSGDLGIDAEHRWNYEWMGRRHSITFKTKSSFGTTNALILFRCPQGVQVAICMPKLEIGKDATTYIPNEDDLVGNDGQSIRGKTGRFYYYAQEWTNSSSPLYIVTDAQAPYFLYNNNYWVFNPEENYPNGISMSAMGTPSSNNSKWQLMTNDFKYIITQAIFGKYAQLGSAIFNEDWLVSQHGSNKKYTFTGSYSRSAATYAIISPQQSVKVKKGVRYNFDINCYFRAESSASTDLWLCVCFGTTESAISTSSTTSVYAETGVNSPHIETISYVASADGYVKIAAKGWGVVLSIACLTNDQYQTMSPSFPNTDWQLAFKTQAWSTSTGKYNNVDHYQSIGSGVFKMIIGHTYDLKVTYKGTAGGHFIVRRTDSGSVLKEEWIGFVGGASGVTTTSFDGYAPLYASLADSDGGVGSMYDFEVCAEAGTHGTQFTIYEVWVRDRGAFVPKVAVDWLSGYAHFGGGKERFEPDGSGQLAGGNIKWDENGYGQLAGGGITWDANKLNVQGRITADMLFAKSLMVGTANYTIDLENNPYNMYYVVNAGHDITLPLSGSYGGVILRFASLIGKPQGGSTTVYGIKLITSSGDYIRVKDGWGAYASSYTTVYIQNFQIVSIAAVGGVWIVMSGMVGASPEPMPA